MPEINQNILRRLDNILYVLGLDCFGLEDVTFLLVCLFFSKQAAEYNITT